MSPDINTSPFPRWGKVVEGRMRVLMQPLNFLLSKNPLNPHVVFVGLQDLWG